MDEPTPILAAVYRGKPDEIAAALGGRPAPTVFEAAARGADVNARAAGGHTALHEAAFRGNLELAQLLLAHGADATARNDDGQTALDIAQAKGPAALARRLRGELP